MTSREALEQICTKCEYNLSLSYKLCPFRSISNEYCDEYYEILRDLELLEKIKEEYKNGKRIHYYESEQ